MGRYASPFSLLLTCHCSKLTSIICCTLSPFSFYKCRYKYRFPVIVFLLLVGFCVTLNEAKGLDLRLPGSESNNLLPSIGRGGVFAKMRLVDMHGHSGGGAIRQSEAIKSPSFTPAPKVAFSDFSVIFQAKDGIEHAEFVRVEIVLEDLTATALLGAALIPLEYFQLKQQTFTFPLARCHRVAMTPRPEYVRHPLGELTVTLHRIEELDESRATMAVRPLLTEVNIFNTRWMTGTHCY